MPDAVIVTWLTALTVAVVVIIVMMGRAERAAFEALSMASDADTAREPWPTEEGDRWPPVQSEADVFESETGPVFDRAALPRPTRARDIPANAVTADNVAAGAVRASDLFADRPDNRLSDPPMIDGYTLRDWLIHAHPSKDHAWAEIVAEFYNRAAAVPEVAAYFQRTDLDELQRHFTRALILVTHTGVTTRLVASLAERHSNVHNGPGDTEAERGDPITGPIYDAVIGTLVAILAENGVPRRGLDALATTIAPFRAALVREP